MGKAFVEPFAISEWAVERIMVNKKIYSDVKLTKSGCLTKVKEQFAQFFLFFFTNDWNRRIQAFLKGISTECYTTRIWTWLIDFITYNDRHYATRTSYIDICVCVCVCVCSCVCVCVGVSVSVWRYPPRPTYDRGDNRTNEQTQTICLGLTQEQKEELCNTTFPIAYMD